MAEENGRANEFTRVRSDFVKVVTKDPRKTSFFICKAVEVIFCIIAIGLSDKPLDNYRIRDFINEFNETDAIVIFVSFYGFTLMNAILVLAHILGDELPKRLLMIFAGVASVLCCIAGVILIVKSDENHIVPEDMQLVSSGVFAILASLTFALETLLTYKYA